jgi:TonB family protein
MRTRLGASSLLLVCLACLAVAQDTAPESRHEVSPSEASASRTSMVAPVYPPLARQARIQGIVVLKAIISKSGDVESLQLVSGHPILAPSAIEAVKQWKYKPFLVDGEPVEVETTVQVNFTLAGAPAQQTDAPPNSSSTPPQQPDASAPPQRVRVSSGVMAGLLISKVNPTYPDDARQARIQGVVVLHVQIDKEGNVEKIELISGHPLLAPAAIEAVQQWKYKPYLLNGNPIEVDSQVQVNFMLAGG